MGTDHITQVLLKEEGVHVPPPETQNKNERSSFLVHILLYKFSLLVNQPIYKMKYATKILLVASNL